MEYTNENVLDALGHVLYPDSEKDLVSLNMIDDVKIEGKNISFKLVLPTNNNPFKNSIQNACIDAVKSFIDKEAEVKVEITSKISIGRIDEKKVLPNVKNIVAVASGKGGVGKSTVASNLAVSLALSGAKVGLIDADIYGPSIPKMFAVENEKPVLQDVDGKNQIVPVEKYGVKMLSIGFFANQSDALVWRGPMATSALQQLINDGYWGDLDYLLIDLPPGTSDIHLTMVQTVPVTGAVIVSTPQDVALADAIKGISMFKGEKINVPVLGLIENMAWFTPEELPENKYYIFGKDGCKKLAQKLNVPLLGQIPIVQSIREGGDIGKPSALEDTPTGNAFRKLSENVAKEIAFRNANLAPTKKVEITNTDGCSAAKN
ncbi:MAG: Mrp/NBP35 family ATP-binding protein [Chlorobi bacterium]|nr:Mrp/NBP35 family ATP-binding protein [Chlorobiota bacterium]